MLSFENSSVTCVSTDVSLFPSTIEKSQTFRVQLFFSVHEDRFDDNDIFLYFWIFISGMTQALKHVFTGPNQILYR